ncbi:MAG: hypothetical protein A2149_01070 [Candidatus Schekmanbacteria bacterium RBG_16_38_11]|uniref:BIG2 domain-containing protein n=1 Tax=Candidatus Schekmanbacteria bacterium RBG_16_38_11 TaxID=1817880 RepID=A0A1F7S121_9BACT|nr:MAG: hypothetical protein A2149_01070 [Candidatus Schekmanbacteria bacterium RBG_16_38_11]
MSLIFKNKRRSARLVLNISLIIFFCFLSEISFPKSRNIIIKLYPSKTTNLILGGKKRITAQVKGTKNKGIIWTLEGEGTIQELSPSKILYSSPESFSIPPAVTTITATSVKDTTASGTVQIIFKNIPFSGLVNNEITFSTEADMYTSTIKSEDISNGVATKITPQITFSSTAPPKITIKLSPLEAVSAAAATANLSLTFKLITASGKTISATLKNINLIKDSSSVLSINVPYDDRIIGYTLFDPQGYDVGGGFVINKVSGKIGNDKDTGPILTNGTDSLSFDPLVFKQKLIEKLLEEFKDYGINESDLNLNLLNLVGTFTYSIRLKGTSIAVDVGGGKYMKINSITGNVTVQ